MAILVLVAEPGTGIDPGSGIVAGVLDANTPPGHFRVWFEGNRNGAVNLQRWADRVHCAADRMVTSYPTIAVRDIDSLYFKALGTYDITTGLFTWGVPHWRESLSAWLGRPVEDDDLVTSVAENRRNAAALRRLTHPGASGTAFNRG